jgi:hypothetical protein
MMHLSIFRIGRRVCYDRTAITRLQRNTLQFAWGSLNQFNWRTNNCWHHDNRFYHRLFSKREVLPIIDGERYPYCRQMASTATTHEKNSIEVIPKPHRVQRQKLVSWLFTFGAGAQCGNPEFELLRSLGKRMSVGTETKHLDDIQNGRMHEAVWAEIGRQRPCARKMKKP